MSIDMHDLEVDMYCDSWKRRKYMSIDTLEIEMTYITKQLKYYEL